MTGSRPVRRALHRSVRRSALVGMAAALGGLVAAQASSASPTTLPWMTRAIVARQAAARTDAARQAVARDRARLLVAFSRVDLAPGASTRVAMTVDPRSSSHPLAEWNEAAGRWIAPPGRYVFWVGNSSSPADLAVAGTLDR